ncbi:MAG: hypothetical protein LLG00_04145, partial [Planctomycetaceae bacterium]|nr:hypothetical protein [Planctomycetaceae bacterium]
MRNGSNRQPPVQCEHPTVGWWIAWAALLAAPAIGLVWARIGHVVQSYFAPAIIFPLLLGAFAGLTVIGLVRLLRIGHRTTILAAALLAAIVAATGQHYFSYLAQYSWRPAASLAHDFPLTDVAPGFNRYLSRQAEIGRPLPGGYLARGWVAWLTWSIDALLVAAGALIVTLLALRVPYCNRCGQWYRTIRNGKIDLVTAARLATLLDVE